MVKVRFIAKQKLKQWHTFDIVSGYKGRKKRKILYKDALGFLFQKGFFFLSFYWFWFIVFIYLFTALVIYCIPCTRYIFREKLECDIVLIKGSQIFANDITRVTLDNKMIQITVSMWTPKRKYFIENPVIWVLYCIVENNTWPDKMPFHFI